MRIMIVTVLALLVASSSAFAIGGQDILIQNTQIPGQDLPLDVVATEDGILFAACHGDPGLTTLNIFRSTNGGNTWNLWDQLTSNFGNIHNAALAVGNSSPPKTICGLDRSRGHYPDLL